MPKTKLSTKVEADKQQVKELKDPKKLYPEFFQFEGMWRIKYTGGGRLPKELEGQYLTRTDAENKIKLYQENA